MRIGRRVARVVFWGLVFCLSVLGGGIWFAYTYVTDSETAARWVRLYAVRYLPNSQVDASRVRVRLSQWTLNNTRINQRIDGLWFEAVRVPYLHILINWRKLLHGELELREVDVVQPSLRLCQRADGTWNLQGLLADPWPSPWLDRTPPIVIQNGTIELVCRGEDPGSSPRSAPILRDVGVRIEQVEGLLYRFEGSAKGDVLDRLRLSGTADLGTGRLELEGDLRGLTISEALRQRVPPEARPAFRALALNGGVVDLERVRARYDLKAPPDRRLHYAVQAHLREGVWNCPKLPYPVDGLSADCDVEDGTLTLRRAEGYHGRTTLRAHGRIRLGDPAREPMDLHVGLSEFELDRRRLEDWTPPEQRDLWDLFQPGGLIGVEIDVARAEPGGPVEMGATVTCHDVAATYRHFPYPLEHVRGTLDLRKDSLTVDVQTLSVGGRPLRMKGVIDHPGPDAVVRLDVTAESVPVDQTLRQALQPDVRKVVDQFHPSGTVKAHAVVYREPMAGRPEGKILIDAEVDLAERCEITWDGLRYPVRNLTGRLELHPDYWVFKDMRGRNGQEEIRASGWVRKLPGPKLENGDDPLKVHVELDARNLPFSQELRKALPPEWKETWRTINPSGASDVTATVEVEPHRPDRTHIVIVPRPESTVRLLVKRSPSPEQGDPGGEIELRMDDVHGRFVFNDGVVTLSDVGVRFGGAPVRLARGTVRVGKTGRFDLVMKDLWIKGIRLDSELRKKMPPMMAQCAKRVDDGRTFTATGDLRIGWSGHAEEPAWCAWEGVRVVLNDNKVDTGIPLEHIHGEVAQVKGWSNGLGLVVEGIMDLESVVILGQQITRVQAPFVVKDGRADLLDLKGHLLGGDLWGRGWITLDSTPIYGAEMSLHNARLEEYARTVGGRRAYRGTIEARLECGGLGSDIRTLQGRGDAHITDGDLGELPVYIRPVALVNRTLSPDVPRERIKTAFDSVDLDFTIAHGVWRVDPIKLTGNAFSLQGHGTLDPQSNLDLRLKLLLGRGRHFPILSDLAREAATQFLRVRVTGTLGNPDFSVEPLPVLQRDPARAERRPSRIGRAPTAAFGASSLREQ